MHLDHATSVELIHEAVDLGVGSVMYDGSTLAYEANVGGKDGVHAPGVRTNPADAASYVLATRVDALAVAVGSSHAMTTRESVLDDELSPSCSALSMSRWSSTALQGWCPTTAS